MGGRGASSSGGGGNTTLSPTLRAVFGKQGKPQSIDSVLQNTNPNFSTGGTPYRTNCQRCVYAAELGQRGFDVEALPKADRNTDPFNNGNWRNGFVGQTWEGNLGNRTAAVESNIERKMSDWGEGSRAIVYVQWKIGSAHVFNVNNEKGKTVAYDAQSGRRVSLSNYMSQTKPTATMISRVDNLSTPTDLLQYAVKKRGS